MKTAIVILALALLAESATDKGLRAQIAAQAETIAALRVQIGQTSSTNSAQNISRAQSRKQHIETLSKVEDGNAQLDRLLALDADLRTLLTDSRARDLMREARRTATQASQSQNATLADRLQVIIACALVLLLVLVAALFLRIRSIHGVALKARREALNG